MLMKQINQLVNILSIRDYYKTQSILNRCVNEQLTKTEINNCTESVYQEDDTERPQQIRIFVFM